MTDLGVLLNQVCSASSGETDELTLSCRRSICSIVVLRCSIDHQAVTHDRALLDTFIEEVRFVLARALRKFLMLLICKVTVVTGSWVHIYRSNAALS